MPNLKNTNTEIGLETTLPSAWYLEDKVYALECEHIFLKEWICVGREEEIPHPGDNKVLDLYGESILLLRNTEGKLRAFYNVCRHRGAQICPMGEQEDSNDRLPLKGGVIGKNRIMCPYHAWTYDLDGQLQRAPHMTEEMGFKVENVQLHAVACESWGGFIFLNLSPDEAPPFARQVENSNKLFQRYPLADLRIGATIHYEVNANWKVLCENYNECYHCGPVHPELCAIVPAFMRAGGAELDWDIGIPHREGAMTFTQTGLTARRTFPGLSESEKNHHKGDLVYPNLFLSVASDHVTVFILRATSAGHTSIDCHFLFEPFEMDKADFDPSDAVDFWHLVNRQDWSICERVQKGMSARVHERGYFSPMEDWNLDIRQYVSERIGKFVGD
ncbi:MAG: Rieske 2Fe-2S family protein [Gammaproteobacteria bacterium]|jgi:Rieske 2Fe-2S family protein